jgi:dephospho-CoA kinase
LPVLDVDKLGYRVLETQKEAIITRFSQDLDSSWNPSDIMDRQLLGKVIFGNPNKLAALEAIVHPSVNSFTGEWITENGNKTCVINAALLHKSSVFNRLGRIILVTAPFFTRFRRAYRRDKLPWIEILKRFISQRGFDSQYLTGNAEIYRVENPGFSNSQVLQKKLEDRIDNCLERIR